MNIVSEHRAPPIHASAPGLRTDFRPLTWAGIVLTVVIAIADWRVSGVSLGYLYLVPILLLSGRLPSWGVPIYAVGCAVMAQLFAPHAPLELQVTRFSIQISVFVVGGLLAARIDRNRRVTEIQYRELQRQIVLRQEAEEQWVSFINTSLAAILTTDGRGTILLANHSAGRMFAGAEGANIEGDNILTYLPFLVLPDSMQDAKLRLRTMLEGRALQKDRSIFYAQVWVSCYQTSAGLRMSVIVWDASEQRRESEELGLRQLLASSHILTGAVAHEIRNLSTAISLHHHALIQVPELAANPNVRALGTLVKSLTEFASAELRSVSGSNTTEVDVKALLEDVAFVVHPSLDPGIQVAWEIPDNLPKVRADQSALLQVLMNLIGNARRAVQDRDDAHIIITAYVMGPRVVIRVRNDGPAIRAIESLFEPFQPGAVGTGLGLYVSRAIVRTFGGELSCANYDGWSCFLVELMQVQPASSAIAH